MDTDQIRPPGVPPRDEGYAPAIAQPEDSQSTNGMHPVPEVREAHDAEDHTELRQDPAHEDAKLDVGLDETFPGSDVPANTAPGNGEPALSSGYDEEAERKIAEERASTGN